MTNNLSFISNNVKGIQAISKWVKIVEYLKNYVTSNDFIFLQETHSSVKDEKVWGDKFEGQLFFSHGNRVVNISQSSSETLFKIFRFTVGSSCFKKSLFAQASVCIASTNAKKSKW